MAFKNNSGLNPSNLNLYSVEAHNKKYEFWQRDSLAIPLFTGAVEIQKLNYIHNNPCKGKWMLAASPIDYKFSSAGFYETGNDEYGFLTHVGDRL